VNEFSFHVVPDANWASRLGASCPRVGLLETKLPAAGFGTGMSAVAAHAVPRIRSKAVLLASPLTAAAGVQLGQPDNHNYMTRVYAVGEGASGPPPHREPA
jgi:hypothetical protein